MSKNNSDGQEFNKEALIQMLEQRISKFEEQRRQHAEQARAQDAALLGAIQSTQELLQEVKGEPVQPVELDEISINEVEEAA